MLFPAPARVEKGATLPNFYRVHIAYERPTRITIFIAFCEHSSCFILIVAIRVIQYLLIFA